MAEQRESQDGFGTGLRAALARARDRRDEEAAAVEPRHARVTSPELALVAGDVTAAPAEDPAGAEHVPPVAAAPRSGVAFTGPKTV